MKYIVNFFKLIGKFLAKLDNDKVGAFSAQSAFFFILSIFPMFMLILAIMKYTPLTEAHLIRFINELLPSALANSFNRIINDTYSNSSIALISLSGIITLWTASKGVASITFGFENIYGSIKDKRNYFLVRFLSTVYTVIFICAFVLTLALLVFGNRLVNLFATKSVLLHEISVTLIDIRAVYIPIILTLIFCGIYIIAAPKHTKLFSQLPGALFSSIGWIAFSYLFSFYVDNFDNYSYIYGSITTIILLMTWIYICIYILFLGVEINIFFRNFFSKARKKAIDKIKKH